MKAIWNDTVLAEAKQDDLIRIEGNWYFPRSSLKNEYFSDSTMKTTCMWKGEARYFNVEVQDMKNESCAWYYPEPKEGSIERVGKDYTNYVAFWRGVDVEE